MFISPNIKYFWSYYWVRTQWFYFQHNHTYAVFGVISNVRHMPKYDVVPQYHCYTQPHFEYGIWGYGRKYLRIPFQKPKITYIHWKMWFFYTWWRHQMETFFALLAFCAGNSLVTVEFPAQRHVTRSFDVFLDLRLNGWVNTRNAGDLRRHRAHYDVSVMTHSEV